MGGELFKRLAAPEGVVRAAVVGNDSRRISPLLAARHIIHLGASHAAHRQASQEDPSQVALGAYLGGSGSINNAAAAAALGARLRFSKHWTFGLDAEWNPWIAVNGASTVRAGVFNGYGTVIFRLPLAYEQFNLRTTANLGVSRLLIDLYGAPKGSTGIYAGLSPLGLEWKMSRVFFLIINPLNFAMPTPQLKGVPFSYSQYRFTIGLEVYGG